MYLRKLFRRKSRYIYLDSSNLKNDVSKSKKRMVFLTVTAILFLFVASAFLFLNDISSQIAVSDACDIVTVKVNRTIADIFREDRI